MHFSRRARRAPAYMQLLEIFPFCGVPNFHTPADWTTRRNGPKPTKPFYPSSCIKTPKSPDF
jgi:hypothetical protein